MFQILNMRIDVLQLDPSYRAQQDILILKISCINFFLCNTHTQHFNMHIYIMIFHPSIFSL